MNTNLFNPPETTQETTHETTVPATADWELAVALDLLAAGGLGAEAVYDGDAEGCPHCVSQVLSEAA
jgi:hypothetical protein